MTLLIIERSDIQEDLIKLGFTEEEASSWAYANEDKLISDTLQFYSNALAKANSQRKDK